MNIDIACLSNNHIRDYGVIGVIDTINVCNENMISTVGAGKNIYDASKPLVKIIKDKKIAFFNF